MWRKLARSVVVAAILLGGVEVGLRVLVSRDALVFSWEREGEALAIGAEGVVEARASSEATKRDGPYPWRWRTNASGFREDAETPAASPEGVTRYLALGDSWVFGVSTTQGTTLPDGIERRLSTGGRRVEVINAGVPGASGYDLLRRWRVLRDRYTLDGVIVGRPHAHLRQAFVEAERARWYRFRDARPPPDVRLYLLVRRFIAPLRWAAYEPAGSVAPDAAQVEDVVQLAAEVKARGLPVWAVVFPVDLPEARVRREPDPAWTRPLDAAGVPWTGNPLAERDCWGHEDTNHPSEAGYATLAEAVAGLVGGAPSGWTPAGRCGG